MKLSDVYAARPFQLSFEFFPPKTEAGLKALFRHVDALMAFQPGFITCTYGAGGSTREKTLSIVQQAKQRYELPVASHLTCVGSTVDELRDYLRRAQEAEIDNIVALRGDPPRDQKTFTPVEGGLRYANELVNLIHDEFPNYGVAVAGYPETHQEAPSLEIDLQNLKRKVDAGADAVITQMFYDNRDYFAFLEHCDTAGIDVPIVPGLLPVTNLGQIQKLTSLCGARLPQEFVDQLKAKDDPEWQFQVGVEFAIAQVQELVDHGIPGIHFYVLNKSEATSRLLEAVSLPAA